MKKLVLLSVSFCLGFYMYAQQKQAGLSKSFTFTQQQLKDKIMGGWAGQTIGVTFGGPYEFRFEGTFIGDYQPLLWYDGYLKNTMLHNPGLYDDLYMDLTFVDVFEKHGLDAPVDSFANAFANAGYFPYCLREVVPFPQLAVNKRIEPPTMDFGRPNSSESFSRSIFISASSSTSATGACSQSPRQGLASMVRDRSGFV